MLELFVVTFAAFWAWATFRAIVEKFASRVFVLLRPVHPILAALLPLYVLWPHWVSALAVAGLVGLLVAVVDRVFAPTTPTYQPIPQRRTPGGLPTLP